MKTLSLLLLLLTPLVSAQSHSGFARHWGRNYLANDDTSAKIRDRIRQRPAPHPQNANAMLHHWNHVAVDAAGLDHTPVPPGDPRVFGEALGPGRSSRAMAIVHIAMFDAVNSIAGGYRSFTNLDHAPAKASMEAAIAQAAHDTLVAMYPSQADYFDAVVADDLAAIPDGPEKKQGVHLGGRAASLILEARADDGSDVDDPMVGTGFVPSLAPGKWRQDPISQLPNALGAHWGEVAPFAMPSASRFRVPPPPALDSAEYAAAFNEVKQLGGDGVTTPSARTTDQTIAGIFWAYDGTPSLCAPPRLYNQIAMHIADQMGTDVVGLARLLALVNVAMADAGIAIWESKYFYQVWRPITAIREADAGTGPTGAGDGNPATTGDVFFSPLGAPASNLHGPNFTPPFPAYPSGHAGFGGALFQVLRRFYGTDQIAFTFVSDEFNGVTEDNQGNARPLIARSFNSLSEAEEENGQSRIYLGIHFAFDKTDGIAQGRRIGDYVFEHTFTPVGKGAR